MTRVWLRKLPQLLNDMLTHALADEAGVTLIVPVSQGLQPATAPDVVIGTDDESEPSWAQEALWRWPDCRVLLVETGGHQASLFELRPHRTALGEMSLEELVQVVTTVARDPRSGDASTPRQAPADPIHAPTTFSTGGQAASRSRRDPMNEQTGGYDFRGRDESAHYAELIAAVQAIRAELSSRPGAPSPDVQKAITGALALFDVLNNGLSLVAGSQSKASGDMDEFLKNLLTPDVAASA